MASTKKKAEISEPKRYDSALREIITKYKALTTSIAETAGVDILESVVAEICKYWKCKESNFIQACLHVMSMIEIEEASLHVSEWLHEILNAYAKTSSEDSTKKHDWTPIKEVTSNKISLQFRANPKNEGELRIAIEDAAKNHQKIKAVCSNYSGLWTDIGHSNGKIIDTSGLKGSHEIEFLNSYGQRLSLKSFEAGITMEEIQNQLLSKGQVLKNVTNGYGLSLAGTVSTGAHGNGLKTGIVADAVVSFQIFTVDSDWKVKKYQIEKKNGITDQLKFDEKHKTANFQLIQDDEVFNASIVNIGCMGVVYSYVLEVDRSFYVEEERTIYKWSAAKKIIPKLYENKDKDIYNFQIMGSPYAYRLNPDEQEEHRVLISILKLTKSPKGKGERSDGHMDVPMGLLDKGLLAIGNTDPHTIPLIMHLPLAFLEHEKVTLNAVEALNTLSGVVAKEFTGVRTSECAMRSDGPETVIEIMEDLHELYSDIRRSNSRQLVNVPIALRFTDRSDKYMAMGYDCHRPTITIEQSIISGTLGADDTLRKFRKRMFKNFQGRPHWGLLHELDAEKFKILYGTNGRKKFTSALNDFDPNRVFENDFAAWVFGKERRNNKESILSKVCQSEQPIKQSKVQLIKRQPKKQTGILKQGNDGARNGNVCKGTPFDRKKSEVRVDSGEGKGSIEEEELSDTNSGETESSCPSPHVNEHCVTNRWQ